MAWTLHVGASQEGGRVLGWAIGSHEVLGEAKAQAAVGLRGCYELGRWGNEGAWC